MGEGGLAALRAVTVPDCAVTVVTVVAGVIHSAALACSGDCGAGRVCSRKCAGRVMRFVA